jgi:hypothetical protein
MAIWKAKIIEVSNIDASLRQEVKFSIVRPNGQTVIIGGQTITLTAHGNPSNIRARVSETLEQFVRELAQAGSLQVNDEVSVDI